jgi:hypothetical protein
MKTRKSRKLKGTERVRLIDHILGAGFKDNPMPASDCYWVEVSFRVGFLGRNNATRC